MIPDPRIFLFVFFLSVADVAVVRPSIPKGLITLFNNGNPDFNNGAKNLKSPPFCILVNCASDNLISVDEWLAKALRRFATCLFVNNNSSSELPIIVDDNLKITSVSFFIADFNLLSCEFDNFTFKLLYCVILYYTKNYYATYL